MREGIRQHALLHDSHKMFRGGLLWRYVPVIAELIRKHDATSLLDYGSGKGRQYIELEQHKDWNILPLCYDPAYQPYSAKPLQTFDGVICTGVAEHVLAEDIPSFLADVVGYAKSFVFTQIGVVDSHKCLPDGRSVHLTVQLPEWWIQHFENIDHSHIELYVDFTGENNKSVFCHTCCP